ncbi:MAG: hypothetical protein ACOYJ1_07785 [Peptococcales bacterium]
MIGKHKIKIFICLILFISLFLLGCPNLFKVNNEVKEKSRLQIYSMSTGLGAVDNTNTNLHRVTYAINLTNEDDSDTYIEWIEPVLGRGIIDKVITENMQIAVEKTITAKGSLKVEGEFVFATNELSKEQIINLEPFITAIKVGSEQIIILDAQFN